MIPNSAFITVGESRKWVGDVAARRTPAAEYAVLSDGQFSKVLAMVDAGIDPSTLRAGLRFAAQAYLKSWDQENIYLGEEFPGIQYLAVHAALRRRKRIAMLVHNVASMRRRLPLATLRLGRLVDHFLCLSTESGKELVERYGAPPSRVTVIGSRVDTEFFRPEPDAPIEVAVCSAGAVNRDYATLVEAVRPLGVVTKIAADTAWRYSTKEQAVMALPPFVEMRSWGSYLNLRQLYARSAVVVVPLERGLLSGVTVALEAMAMGRPVILTRNPYVEDFLVDGESGYFVRGNDAGALTEKIRHVLDHPDEAARVGARAREWVVERFTVGRYVDRILAVFG